jgi:hypothetical protein
MEQMVPEEKKMGSNSSYLEIICNTSGTFSGLENVLRINREQTCGEQHYTPSYLIGGGEAYFSGTSYVQRNGESRYNTTFAPRILDSVLKPEERKRIFRSFLDAGSVELVEMENAVKEVMNAFNYANVTHAEASRVVNDAFSYYAQLIKARPESVRSYLDEPEKRSEE